MLLSTRYISTSLAIIGSVSAQYVPDKNAEIIRELEHVYLDAGSAALITAVSPCTNYEDPTTGASSNSLGRQSAAEWIRTAFRKPYLFSLCVFSQNISLHCALLDRYRRV